MHRLTLHVLALGLVFSSVQCGKKTTERARFTNAATLSAGYLNTCTTQFGGSLYCWGENLSGQVGSFAASVCSYSGVPFLCQKTPRNVTSLTSGVVISSVGFGHVCAGISGNGKCWGNNTSGQIGDSTTTSQTTPTQISSLTSSVSSLAAGYNHTCGVQSGGAYCWGDNTLGQLGDASNTASYVPVAVSGLAANVLRVSAGTSTSCALLNTGVIQCWGANTTGQLGDGTVVASSNVPVVAVAANATAVASAVGLTPGHVCAIVSGAAKCWGLNALGQLGDATILPRNTPTAVNGLTSGVTSIATGASHTCAVVDGGVKCWGLNSDGQLGSTTPDICTVGSDVYNCSLVPVSVPTLDEGVTSVVAGYQHTCALLEDGTIKCWGGNTAGQLGKNDTASAPTPQYVLE